MIVSDWMQKRLKSVGLLVRSYVLWDVFDTQICVLV